MTGFATQSYDVTQGSLRVSARSLNHKYFDFKTNLPIALGRQEADAKAFAKSLFERGTIVLEYDIQVASAGNGFSGFESWYRAKQKEKPELPETIDWVSLWRLEAADSFGLVSLEANPEDIDVLNAVSRKVIEALYNERCRAGIAIRSLFVTHHSIAMSLLDDVKALLPARERERYEHSVKSLQELQSKLITSEDERRLFEDPFDTLARNFLKKNLDEEIDRLELHLTHFRTLLETNGPTGKKISFLLQELLREANTINAKAEDSAIANKIIGLKHEIESMREQAANIV